MFVFVFVLLPAFRLASGRRRWRGCLPAAAAAAATATAAVAVVVAVLGIVLRG